MSNCVDLSVAKTLRRGDTLYHNILAFDREDGTKYPATCRVAGKVRELPEGNPERFAIPVVRGYGDKARTQLTWMSRDLWRTTPEPVRSARRVRAVLAVDSSDDQEPAVVVARPRRRR